MFSEGSQWREEDAGGAPVHDDPRHGGGQEGEAQGPPPAPAVQVMLTWGKRESNFALK